MDRCRLGGCLFEECWGWRNWCTIYLSKAEKGDGKLGVGWYTFENRANSWLPKTPNIIIMAKDTDFRNSKIFCQ